MKYNFTYLLGFVILLMFFPILSCKKDKKNAEIELVTLSTGDGSFAPFELVQLDLPDITTENAETNTEINGKSVKVSILNNQAIFVVPDLAPGSYTLKFTAAERTFTAALKVIAAPSIAQPAQYAERVEESIDSSILSLQQYANHAELSTEAKSAARADAQLYSQLLSTYKQQYEQLTAEQKQEFARVIAANLDWITEIRSSLSATNTKDYLRLSRQPSTLSTVADFEQAQRDAISNWLRSTRVLLRNITKLAALLYAMPVTGAIPIVGTLATGIAVGYMFTEVMSSLSQNMTLMGVVVETAFLPYQNLSLGDFTSDVYNNAQEKVYTAKASFRKLMTGDESGAEAGETLQQFLTNYTNFKTSIGSLIQKLPNRFKPSVWIADFKTGVQAVTRNVNSKYISISNISNSAVQLTATKLTDGSVKLVARTSATTDQDFSYDVTYSNPATSSKELKKTVTAKVKAEVDSSSIYAAAAAGTWINTWPEGQVDEIQLNAGGTGQRTHYTMPNGGRQSIPIGDSRNIVTWRVYKSENRYYLSVGYVNLNVNIGGLISNYPNMVVIGRPRIGDPTYTTTLRK
ncbi:hypothetical protein [Pedobacter sp. SYSU D00535]|uniref:hypothetical protein n=1 Tax=Pedobacter sp. SYSU D00535 TaxID=2810308 RepID=UPI001A96914B|nr:hypothetical protein [Pedobacter sp. SYSU D00535]